MRRRRPNRALRGGPNFSDGLRLVNRTDARRACPPGDTSCRYATDRRLRCTRDADRARAHPTACQHPTPACRLLCAIAHTSQITAHNGRAMCLYTCMAAHTQHTPTAHSGQCAQEVTANMASNAISATIAQARRMAASPATAKVPVTVASIASAAGYPGNKASSVRQLARANGNGARANGQGRYSTQTPAQWVATLTGAHTALSPQATPQQAKAARSAKAKAAWLGKQRAAAKAGSKQAKRQAQADATATEATANN